MEFTVLGAIFFVIFWMHCYALDNKGKCIQEDNCKLPYCFCTNRGLPREARIPGGLEAKELPQQVLVSFDDGINVLNFDLYNRLFPPDKKNPNGCPILATFFVDDMWTNYSMVHELYKRGMEIGVHSVTHRTPTTFWRDISLKDMRFEIRQQKLNICVKGKVKGRDIRGYRSPFLETSGDVMFKVMRENRFEYDTSYKGRFTTAKTPQQWPFTLDFGFKLACRNYNCPKKRYPGFWEVPVIALNDLNDEFICTYADSCFNRPNTREETFEFLWKNFVMNYEGVRAPLYINLHSSFFTAFNAGFRIDAMEDFIHQLTQMEEVYFVTYHQSIEWIRNPARLSNIKSFKPWLCS